MSNTITAYFKGRVGVAESVYQNDYGIVMAFDSIVLPAHFNCYFSRLNQEEALPGLGADNRVTIPNSILANPGNVTIHIPLHTGEDDSEVEYVIYFKVIGRARPIDDGAPAQMTAIERALALLSQPITNIEEIVNEALSFTGDTFDEMQAALDDWKDDTEDDLDDWKTGVEGGLATWKTGVETDFDVLQGQFDTAVAAVTTDTEVTDIRVGADGVTDTTAGASVRRQFTNLKSDLGLLQADSVEKIGIHIGLSDFLITGYIKTDGTTDNDDRFSHTAFIPISAQNKIIINACKEAGQLVVAFYSDTSISSFVSGKTFAQLGNVNPVAVEIPATANYVMFAMRNSYSVFDADVYGNIHTALIDRNQWSIKSLDIRKGLTASYKRRADSFTVKIDVTNVGTINCYAGITSDSSSRQSFVYNSSGTRLDFYNGFVERSITLPANSSYFLLTADWDSREMVYIKDGDGNYLFKYNKSVEFPSRHDYKTIKIAEWNVGSWDSEYNWIDGQAVKTEHTGAELKELLKTLFTDLNADIITLCEYVDTYDGVNIYDEVLKHFYKYFYTWNLEGGSTVPRIGVFSKFPLYLSSYYMADGAPTNFVGGYIMIDTETQMGFTGIHLTANSAADRITEINAAVDMYDDYDVAFFSGDMNTGNNGESSSDIQAQITPFINAGYEPSNRGFWGDIPTYYQPLNALDNIYVKGATINKLTAFEDRPGSDHNPIVADITLFV